jgi:hypothetical protein
MEQVVCQCEPTELVESESQVGLGRLYANAGSLRHEKLRRRCRHICVNKFKVLRKSGVGMHAFPQK